MSEIVEVYRGLENEEIDPQVQVVFSDGMVVRFWMTGLTDEEYCRRAIAVRELENKK